MKFTKYKIKRDYANDTGFFQVGRLNRFGLHPLGGGVVSTCGFGFGFQLRAGAHVYGCSVTLLEPRS